MVPPAILRRSTSPHLLLGSSFRSRARLSIPGLALRQVVVVVVVMMVPPAILRRSTSPHLLLGGSFRSRARLSIPGLALRQVVVVGVVMMVPPSHPSPQHQP